jgi:hypothetical protein
MISGRSTIAVWLVLALPPFGCSQDKQVISSPPDGGQCLPISDDASIADMGVVKVVGVAEPRIGRRAGCEQAVAPQDAGDCSDPGDLSRCPNPFYDAGLSRYDVIMRYGPCACLLGDAGTH